MDTMWWVCRVVFARRMAIGPELSRLASRTVSKLNYKVNKINHLILGNPLVYCLKPPQIEHARNSALPEQETFDLDSTVQYHCHTGYVTNGFPRAKCLAIDNLASWYGPDIQCERE